MGCESYPLPSYLVLSNWSYSIMLTYSEYPSTPQVHLPNPGPTISPSWLSPASALPQRIVHIWGGRPNFPLWLPSVSWCTLIWGEFPRLPLPPPSGGIPTPRLPHVFPSSLWSAFPPGDGTPPILWLNCIVSSGTSPWNIWMVDVIIHARTIPAGIYNLFQPKMSIFSTHALIWVHHKVVSRFSRQTLHQFSYCNRPRNDLVFSLCCVSNRFWIFLMVVDKLYLQYYNYLFLVFSQKFWFPFLHLKRAHIFCRYLRKSLSKGGWNKKISLMLIKILFNNTFSKIYI